MADGSWDGVVGIAVAALGMTAADASVCRDVIDHEFGRQTPLDARI